MKSFSKVIDHQLTISKFLIGEEVTLADIIIGSFLNVHFVMRFEESFRNSVPHLSAWFSALSVSEQFAKVYGEIKLCKQERLPKVKKEEKKVE